MTFKGKVAVVTGAASDIGTAVVRLLSAKGALVLAADRAGSGVDRLAAPSVEVWHADPTRGDDVIGIAARAVGLWGGIDVFFNNADAQGPTEPLATYPDDAFDEVIDANLRPVFLGLKHILPHIRDGGAVVNLASEMAIVGAPGLSGYVASKHGVLGLTKVAALECERRRIRVNAICPTRAQPDRGMTCDSAEDIADLVAFLLSDGGPAHHRADAVIDLPDTSSAFALGKGGAFTPTALQEVDPPRQVR